MTNVSRYAQVGTWEGTLEVPGATYTVSPDTWKGARDHSWGIRPVGEPEPRGIRAKARAAGTTGQWHNWIPMQFDDRMIKVMLDEESDGTRIVAEAALVWNDGIDREPEEFGVPEISIDYISGTREMERAVVELTALVGYYTMVAMTLNAHEIPLPEDVAPAFRLPQHGAMP